MSNLGKNVAWSTGKGHRDLMLGKIVEESNNHFYTVEYISMTSSRRNAKRPAPGARFLVMKGFCQIQ